MGLVNEEIDRSVSNPSAARKRPFLRGSLVLLAVLLLLCVYNAFVFVPVAKARSGESGVTLVAYRQWGVNPNVVVLDVWKVSGTSSMADVDRNTFKAAEALKGRRFEKIELAYRGRGRLLIDGAAFQRLGEDWQSRSLSDLIGTLPQNASKMDGSPAFGTWTGGWLGVLLNQMKDHNRLHWAWYLAEVSGADPNSEMPEMPDSPS
jgi:hypothetical protein